MSLKKPDTNAKSKKRDDFLKKEKIQGVYSFNTKSSMEDILDLARDHFGGDYLQNIEQGNTCLYFGIEESTPWFGPHIYLTVCPADKNGEIEVEIKHREREREVKKFLEISSAKL